MKHSFIEKRFGQRPQESLRLSRGLLRRYFAITLVAATVMGSLVAEDTPSAVFLWSGDAPGSEGKIEPEAMRLTNSGERVISRVHRPSLTPYLTDPQSGQSAAVIIARGGGHRELWSDHEGHHLAKFLSSRGIAAFVLKYRLAREQGSSYSVDEHALADMRRAIRIVRARAKEWRIDPDRIGVLGFSAGGELAALAAMTFPAPHEESPDLVERQSNRPDFHALIYPGSSRRYNPTPDSPPAFIVCGFKDRPDISRGMAEVYLKYHTARVPTELHIYAGAGHGFGVRDRTTGLVAGWTERLVEWIKTLPMTK